ncbi:MAG: hypothetical protein QF885_03250 [Candidatus Thalassarchaeaceae archaeon]|nr:hypothetical protein [Candidatus Thalassarchaeaceae archaeon]
MRESYARRFAALVAVLLLVIPLLATVSASGQGLLLDSSTIAVLGDMEEGQGDVNISIDVEAHDISALGSLNFTLVEGESTLIASENVSLNLSAEQIMTIQFNVSQLPVGQYTLDLQLHGNVGISGGNYTDHISQFVKRLAPANPIVGDESSWGVTPVNLDSGEASGNSTFRDGDGGWALIPVTNSGEVEWNGSLGFSLNGGDYLYQNMSVSAQSTSSANFTIPQLSESNSAVLSVNLSGSISTKSIVVGPPPLARLILTAEVSNSTAGLGDEVTWTLNASNSGEVDWSGNLVCTFSNGSLFDDSLFIAIGAVESRQITLSVRPGNLFCELQGIARLHDDSVTSSLHVYDMDAAHFSTAGSTGLAVEGTNFHVGDALDATIIVHNGGDFVGNARLVLTDSGSTSQGVAREFQVGNSLQLSISHILAGSSGNRDISWAVISEDGLVDSNLSGIVSVLVNPSQQLSVSTATTVWTTSDGLSAEVELGLSEGRSRNVQLIVGFSDDGDSTTVINSVVQLSPGLRTLSFSLGEPTAADEVWAQVVVSDWSPSGTSTLSDVRSVSAPNVIPTAILGISNPAVPVNGDTVTLAYTLSNAGTDNIAGGWLLLKLSSTNEILWEGSAPLVEAGGSESGEIEIDSWPKGNLIDVELEWRTTTIEITTMKSYPSKSGIISEEFDIPWSALIYGSIAGIVLASIARFVFVWQGEDPGERKEMKQARRKARDDARSAARRAREEKVTPKAKQEVPCPSCDMVLRVPHDYDGQARCPACTHVFPVTPVERPAEEEVSSVQVDSTPEPEVEPVQEEEPEQAIPKPVAAPKVKQRQPRQKVREKSKSEPKPSVSKTASADDKLVSVSTNDEIRCPSCGQRLRVPYDKRPVTARCPRCEIKFLAEKK